VPVAEINLHPGDSVFFEHRVMLWKDESISLSLMSLAGGALSRLCIPAKRPARPGLRCRRLWR
jgi:uncharacterized protein (AIM24 family)